VRDDRDPRRLVGHAHPPRLDRRDQGRGGRRGRRRRDDRSERRAGGERSARPPRDPADGRRVRLRRPALDADAPRRRRLRRAERRCGHAGRGRDGSGCHRAAGADRLASRRPAVRCPASRRPAPLRSGFGADGRGEPRLGRRARRRRRDAAGLASAARAPPGPVGCGAVARGRGLGREPIRGSDRRSCGPSPRARRARRARGAHGAVPSPRLADDPGGPPCDGRGGAASASERRPCAPRCDGEPRRRDHGARGSGRGAPSRSASAGDARSRPLRALRRAGHGSGRPPYADGPREGRERRRRSGCSRHARSRADARNDAGAGGVATTAEGEAESAGTPGARRRRPLRLDGSAARPRRAEASSRRCAHRLEGRARARAPRRPGARVRRTPPFATTAAPETPSYD
jgi:hypothetical protein